MKLVKELIYQEYEYENEIQLNAHIDNMLKKGWKLESHSQTEYKAIFSMEK